MPVEDAKHRPRPLHFGHCVPHGRTPMLLGVSDSSLGGVLREAGSSVTTLGFGSTKGVGPTMIDVFAAVSGLVVIALTSPIFRRSM
jgi:hypothetical protein